MVAIPAILILGPIIQRAVDRWLRKPATSSFVPGQPTSA
jgi:hypothetical protein